MLKRDQFIDYLKNFRLSLSNKTSVDYIEINGKKIPRFVNEFWTSKQRQANKLHEVAYRACFKPQLPRFFIELLTNKKDWVYDPFSGRGTTIIEAAILKRNIISNDINPISTILCKSRLYPPKIEELNYRLSQIDFTKNIKSDMDLSMFYHPKTLTEILSIRKYLKTKKESGQEDDLDKWIRMVATNRLTGHSSGFFSVYTLPPNQAVSQESQKKINIKLRQKPTYRDTKKIILHKTKSLIKEINNKILSDLLSVKSKALFLENDARYTKKIKSNLVKLVVTSPPFLDVVQYMADNWLRCWFNDINAKKVEKKITIVKEISDWSAIMKKVFFELYRILKKSGFVAFEVGEVKGGKINLDEFVIPLGLNAGFECIGIMINNQKFTKTSNIWGISNNNKGTNSNRIVIYYKN